MYISADVHPVNGTPLISALDGKRHYEIFRGRTEDGGKTWNWQAITSNSTVDNIRPIVPISASGQSAVLWMSGSYTNFANYDMDIVGFVK